MMTKFKKVLSLFVCFMMIISVSSVCYVSAVGESSEDFCKIKRTTATVTIMPLEKLDLYAEYNVTSDTEYKFEWSIEGNSHFINDGVSKTSVGTDVEMLFLDDTTVKLQIISDDGRMLCEDEIFLKSYRNNDTPFWVEIEATLLFAVMLLTVFIGSPIGSFVKFISNLNAR